MTFNRETTLNISFGIQYCLHLHFCLIWKEWIACALKIWRSWINVRDAGFFVFHAIEREISLSNNTTLSQSELNRMFFIMYNKRKRYFCSLRVKKPRIWLHLSMLWLWILIVTNKIIFMTKLGPEEKSG